jgi:hypothetical protein
MIMNNNKQIARFVGALFLTAMAASLVGGALVSSILSSDDYLRAISENEPQVIVGALLELVNGVAVIGIGVLMFPFLRQHSMNIALGYLGFRLVEAVFCCVIVITPLSLVALSQEYISAGAAQAAALSTIGALSIAEREGVAGLLIPIFFSIGALLFYASAYQSRLLPRPLAAWGLIGATLIITSTLLLQFNPALSMGVQMIFALPIISNEIFLGIWLIVKGFNTPAFTTRIEWQTSTPLI